MSDEHSGAGVVQLVCHFAFAIRRVERTAHRAELACGVEGDLDFRAVRHEDTEPLSGLESERAKAMCEPVRFDVEIGERQTPVLKYDGDSIRFLIRSLAKSVV